MTINTRRLFKPWAITAALAAWSLIFVACSSSVQRTLTVSAQVPGAKIVGSKECATCHSEIAAKFESSTHAKLNANGVEGSAVGCESCHGAASAHVKAGGGKGTIVNPKKNPDACFTCHIDKRGQFSLPNSHPVMSGKVTCSDCHDPHEGNAIKGKGAATLEGEVATCTKCHVAQKGPYVFKHQAIREGCTACHNPHGTVNAKMLVARDNNLCIKCHMSQPPVKGDGKLIVGSGVLGAQEHQNRIPNGQTCWSAGCHEAVHGSNANKPLRY